MATSSDSRPAQRKARTLPDHEPTPTDFMLYKQWPPEPPAPREPLPMLPMPPIRRSLRRDARRRMSLRTRVAAIAASTLLCGLLIGSAILWVTHHASTTSSATMTLALKKNTPRA